MARRAMSSERPNANHRAGSFGSDRCTTAVTVMTTVVEPAAVKRVWLSNHCGKEVPAPLIAASLRVVSRNYDTQQRRAGREHNRAFRQRSRLGVAVSPR